MSSAEVMRRLALPTHTDSGGGLLVGSKCGKKARIRLGSARVMSM
jgi:hypothetical protein